MCCTRICLGMPQYMDTVYRYIVGSTQPPNESGRTTVLRLRWKESWIIAPKPTSRSCNVLNTNAVRIRRSGVPGDISIPHHLHYLSILSNDIVSADAAGWILEPTNRPINSRTSRSDMDDNAIYLTRPPWTSEVSRWNKTRDLRISCSW